MIQARIPKVRISGIACAVPKNIVGNENFEQYFSTEDIDKITKMTGVKTRHIADEDTCTSDLCIIAAKTLMKDLGWAPDRVDGIIFISQTPDYRLPATSCIVQDKLGISKECAAFDVNLGCSGYVYGLWMASSFIASGSLKRVLLLVGDTISKAISPNDHSTSMLFGDAGTATALEMDDSSSAMSFVLRTDGKGCNNLIIPAGGYRNPVTQENLVRKVQPVGGIRSENDLYMNGGEIFNFTIKRVPSLIKELLSSNNLDINDIDYFVFHQANEFILMHLAKKLKLSLGQTPINIDRYGNTSSASIPLTITSELSEVLRYNKKKLALIGFGVGYSWGGALVDLGPLASIRLLEV
ncbi:MAG: ketoacyl-ACP synthase III [Thermoanaerobacteraceae bacterium]|nr:ketoacyl-ACP synthase III [Thermoanaerobacteraceae bacterium]